MADGTAPAARRAPGRNRVLLVLVPAIAAAGLLLPFLAVAPNRLLSGRPMSLAAALQAGGGTVGLPEALALAPGLVLLAGPFLPAAPRVTAALAAAAALFAAGLVWLAGDAAAAGAAGLPAAARVSLGAGFWCMAVAALLALADLVRRLALPPAGAVAAGAAAAALVVVQLAGGHLDSLSILKEYANRREAFDAAVVRHAVIVGAALAPALLIGLPLGVWAGRSPAAAAVLFPVLNIIQTIPSLALFGLLLAPLAALAAALPWLAGLGVGGVGMAPAVVALTLYGLLPVVRNTAEGLAGVPEGVREAARGMGMTPAQIFWRVEARLALPVVLSGLRITAVQIVGLAAVAALIGAGGLGSIMFQGLFANAHDLVLLGAVPVILFAVAVDALLRVLVSLATERGRA